MTLKTLNISLITAGVLAVGTAGAIGLRPEAAQTPPVAVAAVPLAAAVTTPAAALAPVAPVPAQSIVPNYRAIAAQAGPAVVGITVQGVQKASGQEEQMLPPGLENDPFFRFYRGMPQQRGRQNPSQQFRSQGSGFIISADGLILTNAHVVRDAKQVTVKLSDRREYSAKVLGSDLSTDVAVLRIDAKDLPYVRLGDPQKLEVGDPVLAIGAPYGFEQTATSGIVSAKGRSLPGVADDNGRPMPGSAVVPFIQTDAAVNPGNSGGPLFDGSGAVVGINAQIYSRSGGYQGLSFAIPINVALKVKDQILATGKASHGRLGVGIQDLSQSLAESFGLSRPDGALVSKVDAGTAAAEAGLQPGDVILEVNGEPIERSGSLSSRIGLASPGDKVKLKVWRDRSARVIEAKLGGLPVDKTETAQADAAKGGQLGLALRPLTAQERSRTKLQGLVVEDAAGPAARAGIEPGDVVLAINGKPVTTVEQVRSVLSGKPKSVALLIERDGERIFVPVALG